jgi:hypothetical protein
MTEEKINPTPLELNLQNKEQEKIKNYSHTLQQLFNFSPKILSQDDFLFNNYRLSLFCGILALSSVQYYRIKYFLISSKTLRGFSFMLNYALYMYVFTNGYEFYKHAKTVYEK